MMMHRLTKPKLFHCIYIPSLSRRSTQFDCIYILEENFPSL